VRDVAAFDVEVPTASPRREVRVAKSAVKLAVAWYLRYVSEQLNRFSAATLRMSETLAARVEKAETGLVELAARVDKLEKLAVPASRAKVTGNAAGEEPALAAGQGAAARPARRRSSANPAGRRAKGTGVEG
jgi:hypothetical protein